MKKVPSPPGVFDILPIDPKEQWRSSYLWNYLETVIRETVYAYGYQEIRTPIFERSELFQRGVGETSDIVSKEMYTFQDKGNRWMSLRPEGTAPVVRAFIEHSLHNEAPIHKLFYIAPMFRYDRPQAGRYRQHHQFGVEIIGSEASEHDVELLDMLYTFFQRLGLQNLRVCLNSLGDNESRAAFRKALKDYLKPHLSKLSSDSQARFKHNPLRILDSKDPKDQKIARKAPSILDYLTRESREHFDKVKALLDALKIPYEIDSHLVRGLDYYQETVFEIVAGELGAQNSICGGGRYDGLIKMLGGPDLSGIGFAMGLERLVQTMLKQEVSLPKPYRPTLFMIPLGEKAKTTCFSVAQKLRQGGIGVQIDFSDRKLNKIMRFASQIEAKFVVVVGDQELQSGVVELKEMETGELFKAPLFNLFRILDIEQNGERYLKIWSEINTPFDEKLEADFFFKKLNQSIEQTEQLTEDLTTSVEEMKKILGNSNNSSHT